MRDEGARKLQKAGLIRYSRGHITVLDREGLERRSCECYSVVKKEFDRLLPDRCRLSSVVARRTAAAAHHSPSQTVSRGTRTGLRGRTPAWLPVRRAPRYHSIGPRLARWLLLMSQDHALGNVWIFLVRLWNGRVTVGHDESESLCGTVYSALGMKSDRRRLWKCCHGGFGNAPHHIGVKIQGRR